MHQANYEIKPNLCRQEKTRISFECKQNDKQYTMISKTKDFQFSEETLFKNEIIHFFNIDAFSSILYIYLEIGGKRINSEKNPKNIFKLNLNDESIQNVKKEMNCLIIEDVELTIVVRIISQYIKFFRKKSRSFHKKTRGDKNRGRARKNTVQGKMAKAGMTIKDKIKLFSGFSGQSILKKNNNQVIPGKLKIPKLFQTDNESKNKNNKKEISNNIKIIEEDEKEKK